ncbi:hypothetical protein B6N60_01277 [Richelia sinica FACHB-800]|uniref:Uncharacterized protein n=1 Tax=Richelia sinica FACHB-800 TaxID=1357546 RepID=A0A975T5N9_9NOST|nr:hypothetical protein B6N60_01277 [Richelia sinica FACHB-800]
MSNSYGSKSAHRRENQGVYFILGVNFSACTSTLITT